MKIINVQRGISNYNDFRGPIFTAFTLLFSSVKRALGQDKTPTCGLPDIASLQCCRVGFVVIRDL